MSNGGIHSYLAEKESTAINYSKNPYSSNSAVSSSTAIDKHRNSIQQRIANLEAKILNKTNPHPSSNRNSLYESNKEPKASQLQSISSQYIKNKGTGSFNNLNDHMLNNHLSAYKAPSSVSNPYISYGDSFFANMNNLAQPFQQVSLRQQPQQKSHIYNTHHPHNTSNQALVAQNKLQRDGRSKRSLTSSVNTQIDHKKGINPNNNVNRSRSKSPKRQYSKSKFQMLHGRDQDYPTRKELIKENTGNQIKKQTAQQNYQQRSSITHKSSSKQPIQKGSNQDYQKLSKPSPQLLEQNFIQLNKTISNLRTLSNNGPVNLSFNSTQPLRNSVNHPLRNSRQHHLGNSVNQPFFNPPHGSNLNNVQLYEMMKSILAGQQRLEKELQMIKQKQNSKKNQSSTKYTNGDQKQQEAKDNYQQKKLRHQNKQNIIHGQNSRGRTQKKDVSPRNIGKSHLGLRERSRSAKNCDQSAIDSPVKLRKSKSPLNQSHQNRSKSPHNNKQLSRRKSNVKRVAQNLSQATGHNSTSGNVRNCQGKQVGKISKNKQRFYQLYKMAQQNRRLNPSSGVSVSEDSLSSTWQKVRRVIERSQAQNVETSKISHQNNRYINDHLVNTIQLQRKLKKDLTKKIYDMCQNKCLFK